MRLKYTIEYEADVNPSMYPDDIETNGQVILHELTSFDYRYAMQMLAIGQCTIKISEVKNEETF